MLRVRFLTRASCAAAVAGAAARAARAISAIRRIREDQHANDASGALFRRPRPGHRPYSCPDGRGRKAPEARPEGEGEQHEGAPAAAAAIQDGARPGRRRLHGRRLRDRRPPRARPDGRQPHGQPVRRLCGHERGLVRGLARREWGHARGDDAGRQPAGPDALQGRRPRHADAAERARVRPERGAPAAARAGPGAHLRDAGPQQLADRPRRRAGRGPAVRPLRRQRHPGVPGRRALRPGPRERLPAAPERALPHRHRSRHLRADHPRRPGLGRRADLAGGRRLDGAADGLQAGRDQGPPSRRRRPALDHERRHRGRGGRQVRGRRQPARPVRQRLPEGHPDDVGQPRAARARTWASPRSDTRPSS